MFSKVEPNKMSFAFIDEVKSLDIKTISLQSKGIHQIKRTDNDYHCFRFGYKIPREKPVYIGMPGFITMCENCAKGILCISLD